MKIVLLFIFFVSLTLVKAWWSEGHMLVYEVARQQLILEKKESVLVRVNETLLHMKENDAFKDVYAIASWMDDLKDKGGMKWSGMFHYVDIPYIIDNLNITIHPSVNATGVLVRRILCDVAHREKLSPLSTLNDVLLISIVC